MTTFRYIRVATTRATRLLPQGAEKLLKAMQSRPSWDEVHVSPGKYEYPFFSLSWHHDAGYVVHSFERDEYFSKFLVSGEEMSKPTVFIELGGQTEELWPRELFISIDVARSALEHFVASGLRSPEMNWVRIDRFPRRTVRRKAEGSPTRRPRQKRRSS
jgi:hypothetical protein